MADAQKGAGGLSRRDFLRGGLAIGGTAVFGGLSALAQKSGSSQAILPVRLHARAQQFQIRPGDLTNTYGYDAYIKSTTPLPRMGYLGPVLRVDQGTYLNVDFRNELPEATTVHWHGLDVPALMDGHPSLEVAPGGRYNYAFRIVDRAGMYWFHPHQHMRTGPQVNKGMAGAIIVSDFEEKALRLPQGNRELVFVIQDRSFDAANQFIYSNAAAAGFLGNTMVVNGEIGVLQEVDTAVYRVRILNGCNARILKLAWSDGSPMVVLGSDHGFLRTAETKPYVMLVPGERVDLWVDLRNKPVGAEFRLDSHTFTPGQGSGGSSVPQGYYCQLKSFRVTQEVSDASALPPLLSKIPEYRLEDAANVTSPRVIQITRTGSDWMMNGALFEMDSIAPNEATRKGVLEVWEFHNDVATTQMVHPIHVHGSPFQIIERTVSSTWQAAHATVNQGLVDSGWKDTFLIMPGERVKILTKPLHYSGRFLYHCHNLEHEDMGMMRNYDVI